MYVQVLSLLLLPFLAQAADIDCVLYPDTIDEIPSYFAQLNSALISSSYPIEMNNGHEREVFLFANAYARIILKEQAWKMPRYYPTNKRLNMKGVIVDRVQYNRKQCSVTMLKDTYANLIRLMQCGWHTLPAAHTSWDTYSKEKCFANEHHCIQNIIHMLELTYVAYCVPSPKRNALLLDVRKDKKHEVASKLKLDCFDE